MKYYNKYVVKLTMLSYLNDNYCEHVILIDACVFVNYQEMLSVIIDLNIIIHVGIKLIYAILFL